jgi:hypothetical protein
MLLRYTIPHLASHVMGLIAQWFRDDLQTKYKDRVLAL